MAKTYSEYGVSSTPISGRRLAHSQQDRIGRAFTAADLHSGALHLVKPTLVQSALLCGVNRTYAFWATRRQAERADIEAALIPLVPATPAHANGTAFVVPDIIDDVELIHIANLVGADRMLAAAITASH